MTALVALSAALIAWLLAGAALWGLFVSLGLRFEPRRDAERATRELFTYRDRVASTTEAVRT